MSGVLNRRIDKALTRLETTFINKFRDIETRLGYVENIRRPRSISLPGVDEGEEQFSFFKACMAIASGNWSGAEFEKEVFEQTHKALGAETGPAGGYLVPTEFRDQIIELLYPKSVVFDLGATRLPGLSGSPVEFPKITGGAATGWIGEGATMTESDHTFGQVMLSPKTVYAFTKLSRRLTKLTNSQVEAVIRNDFAKGLALRIDLVALRGSGTENQPLGIANVTGINTVALGTNGATPTIDDLDEMIYQIEKSDADGEEMGWAFNPRTWKTFRGLKDGEGRYYLRPDVSGPAKGTLLGLPYRKTTQIPINLTKGSSTDCSEIYLANWSELLMGEWGSMEILASQEAGTAFADAQLWIRILQDVDIAVRHEVSFCLISDARP